MPKIFGAVGAILSLFASIVLSVFLGFRVGEYLHWPLVAVISFGISFGSGLWASLALLLRALYRRLHDA